MQSLSEIFNGVKIDISPKEELFKWGPIPFKLVYGVSFIDAILRQVPKYYPWPWPPGLCLFKESKMVWINEYPAIADVGLKYFKKYFLNPANYQKLWLRWQEWIANFKNKAKTLEKLDLGHLSEKELIKQFKGFYQLSIDLWLIVHIPEVVNIGLIITFTIN